MVTVEISLGCITILHTEIFEKKKDFQKDLTFMKNEKQKKLALFSFSFFFQILGQDSEHIKVPTNTFIILSQFTNLSRLLITKKIEKFPLLIDICSTHKKA